VPSAIAPALHPPAESKLPAVAASKTVPVSLEQRVALYKRILLESKSANPQYETCFDVTQQLYNGLVDVPQVSTGHAAAPASAANAINLVCQVCFDDDAPLVTVDRCGHSMICRACMSTYARTRIAEKDVTPWIRCPSPQCKCPLSPQYFGVSAADLLAFCREHLYRTLAREDDWVSCSGSEHSAAVPASSSSPSAACGFGFLLKDKAMGVQMTAVCDICGIKQQVKRKQPELTPELQEMIKTGALRSCPKCEQYTIKDYGICNVIQCARCGIWWNWKSRDFGESQDALKAKARSYGTLWEPGELHYQMRLEHSDPAAFKALLERNGIRYDPRYQRGRG